MIEIPERENIGGYKEDPSLRHLLIVPDTKIFNVRKTTDFVTSDLTNFYGGLMKARWDMREMFLEPNTIPQKNNLVSKVKGALANTLRGVAEKLGPIHEVKRKPVVIDPNLVSAKDIKGIWGAGLVEAYNPGYVKNLMQVFGRNLELSSFVSFWDADEVQHFLILQQYLLVLHERAPQMVDLEKWASDLERNRAGSIPDQTRFTLVQLAFQLMLQEYLTALFYKGFEKEAKEPVLKKILKVIEGDEWRHYAYYKKKTKEEVKNNPSALEEIDDFVLNTGFAMPGEPFIPDYKTEVAADISRAAGEGYPNWKQVLLDMQGVFGIKEVTKRFTDSTYRRKFSDQYGVDPGKAMGLG